MTDINRRFSRAAFINQNGSNDHMNNDNNTFNVNQYYNNNYNNKSQLTIGGESIRSVETGATNATNATSNTRRRFSIKLSQPPIGMDAPPLPFNAHNQILNSSLTNLNESNITIKETTNDDSNNILYELSRENFNASTFVQRQLFDADANKIDSFINYLDKLNENNDNEIKFSLSESINQVLAVSNAFKNTNEILNSLKPKINDLTDVLSQQINEANEFMESNNNNNSTTGFKTNRQSIAMLQNKWTNSMKKLYLNIDRAHDLLPPIPMRHILIESRRWGELNSITFKPVRPVHLVIMNDSILIASRIKEINSKKNNSNIRNVATYSWMIDDIIVQNVSDMKNFNQSMDNLNNNNNTNSSSNLSSSLNSNLSTTLCIKQKDSNQIFLFQTDTSIEYLNVINAINQARSEILNLKRRSNNNLSNNPGNHHHHHHNSNSFSNINLTRPNSSHRISSSNNNIEKQIQPEFNSSITLIDDLLTSCSLELGLCRYDECIGYLNRLKEEIKNLLDIGIAIGLSLSLINSKTLNDNNSNIFQRQFHLIYNIKLINIKKIEEKLINSLLNEIKCESNNIEIIKNANEMCLLLNKGKESSEIFLNSRGKLLEEYVGSIRVGGDCGGNNNNNLDDDNLLSELDSPTSPTIPSIKRNLTISRSDSLRTLNIRSSIDNSADLMNSSNNDTIDITGKMIISYIRELSLVYMSFINKIWNEWNEIFIKQSLKGKNKKYISNNLRIIEWINEYLNKLKKSVIVALSEYDRNSITYLSCVKVLREVFETLKDKELNVDYLLDI